MLFTDKDTFYPNKALKRNGLKLTLLFVGLELLMHWMINSGFDNSPNFKLDTKIIYLLVPGIWVFFMLAARAYGIERKEHGIKRLEQDFKYPKTLIDNQDHTQFDIWLKENRSNLRKFELNRLLYYQEYIKNQN
jgi:hypothetical protein